MDHFLYQNGVLHAEDVAIPETGKKKKGFWGRLFKRKKKRG